MMPAHERAAAECNAVGERQRITILTRSRQVLSGCLGVGGGHVEQEHGVVVGGAGLGGVDAEAVPGGAFQGHALEGEGDPADAAAVDEVMLPSGTRPSRAQRGTGSSEAGSGSAVFGTRARTEGVATMARVASRMIAAAA